MDIGKAYEAMKYLLLNKRKNVWLWGEPGIGKTSLAFQLNREVGVKGFMRILPPGISLDPPDLRGLSKFAFAADGVEITKTCPPDFLPRDPNWDGIIVCDEIGGASTDIQKGFLQLTGPPFRYGDYRVPRMARWLFMSNRREDMAGVNPVIAPLENRFFHIDIEPEALRTATHLRKKGIPGGDIIADFIEFRPTLVSTFKPNHPQRAFASGRMYEECCAIVADPPSDPEIFFAVLAGGLSDGVAGELIAYVEARRTIRSVADLIANPTGAAVPNETEPSTCFAVVVMLIDHVRNNPADAPAVLTLLMRLPSDYTMKGIYPLINAVPNIRKTPEYATFVKKYGKLFND